jgi:hypothetical protein
MNPQAEHSPCVVAQSTSESNAPLIAAAPDMLAALKYIADFEPEHLRLREIARAAIAKAEGKR